jgi:glucose/arabinose dehydrogenase
MDKEKMKRFFALIIALAWLSTVSIPQIEAANAGLPPGLQFTTVASGLARPVFVTHAGDGSGRLFIVQQGGQILILKNGSVLPTPFLDLSSLIATTGNEQGLLGLAFHPNYAANGRFFTVYTRKADGDIVLAEFGVSGNPDIANPAPTVLLTIEHSANANHNGGMIAFGPDGYLYQAVGDSGGGGDPDENGQDLTSLLGKILRLDVDSAAPYAIPADNPFVGHPNPNVREEIWTYGLRNPWRFSFDRSTGDLFIGDVGQNAQEEVDFQSASSSGGENYGWDVLEGNLCYEPSSGCTPPPGYVPPVAVYDHGPNDSTGCSLTGGYVYRGSQSPSLTGVYFYGDFCQGTIWGLAQDGSNWNSGLISDTNYLLSSFGEDESGEIYLTDLGGGRVVRISEVTLLRKVFRSNGEYDGAVLESGETTNKGGDFNSADSAIPIGDDAANRQYRGILHFFTGSLPDNAVVASAKLEIKRQGIIGANPFTDHRYILIDIKAGVFSNSAALQASDFQAASSDNWVGKFYNTPSKGWYSTLLYPRGIPFINLKGITQMRLRFRVDDNNNTQADIINFYSGNSANLFTRPRLIVEYYVP